MQKSSPPMRHQKSIKISKSNFVQMFKKSIPLYPLGLTAIANIRQEYKFMKKLGSGAYGVVYKAENKNTGITIWNRSAKSFRIEACY